MESFESLNETKVTISDGTAILTLNRPKSLNAFTTRMQEELIFIFNSLSKDDNVRAIVVTGSGNTFCAGADLSQNSGRSLLSESESRKKTGMTASMSHRDGGGQVSLSILRCRKPVIAAINGSAVGVGITMTLPMDIRVVQEDAKVGFIFGKRGLVPEACSSYILPRIVGISKALDLTLTGRIFLAKEEPSLFTHIVPKEKVLSKALEIAQQIAQCAPSSVTLSRALLWKGLDIQSPEEAHYAESRIIYWCFTESPDTIEGMTSFLQKREPKWKLSSWSDLPVSYPWWISQDITPPVKSKL